MVELLPVPQQDERLGAPLQSPSFGSVEGQLSSIRRDTIPLFLDTQCLTFGGRGCPGLSRGRLGQSRGCLGLGRGLLGLGRVVGLD
jgi:hypothetical protein